VGVSGGGRRCGRRDHREVWFRQMTEFLRNEAAMGRN
jgi:hypothetical protein